MKLRIASLIAILFFTACPDDGPTPVDVPDAGAVEADAEPPASSCSDGLRNGEEGDVDCGGDCERGCSLGQTCGPRDCGPDLVCERPASTPDADPTCHTRLDSCVGNPCGEGEYCDQYGTYNGQTMEDEMVYYCAKLSPGGATCARHFDRDVNTCVAGYRCQDEVCVDAPSLGEGCSPAPFQTACEMDLVCGESDTCVLAADIGEYCLNDVECRVGLYCAGSFGGECQPRPDLGESCNGDVCDVGMDCGFPAGLTCTSWLDCGSQMECCGTDEGGAECRVYDGVSEPCAPPAGRCEVETYI